jgi:hypothetical protein
MFLSGSTDPILLFSGQVNLLEIQFSGCVFFLKRGFDTTAQTAVIYFSLK